MKGDCYFKGGKPQESELDASLTRTKGLSSLLLQGLFSYFESTNIL